MKKYLISFLLVLILAAPAAAIQIDFFNCLYGGTAGCLDHWDGDVLSDGDMAVVAGGPTNSFVCNLDADSAESEVTTGNTPIIAPDNNAGDKRWLCVKVGYASSATITDLDDLPGDTVDDDLIDADLMPQATTSTDGYLSSTDWNLFNDKTGLPANFGVSGSDMTIANGGKIQILTTTDGHGFSIRLHDGSQYRDCLTFENGSNTTDDKPKIIVEEYCRFTGLGSLNIDEISAASTDHDLKLAGNGTGKAKIYSEIQIPVVEWATDVSIGNGKFYWHIGKEHANKNIVYVHAEVITAGVTGTLNIDLRNVTQLDADILSTNLTIATGQTGSDTTTPAVIDTDQDDLQENDLIAIDIDAVQSGTAPKGLIVTIGMELQ